MSRKGIGLTGRLIFIGIVIAAIAAIASGGGNQTPSQPQPAGNPCGAGQVYNGSGCLYPSP